MTTPYDSARRAHRAVIIELARAVVGLGRSGLIWTEACALGHDGIVDNTELASARTALGEDACRALYEEETNRLANPADENLVSRIQRILSIRFNASDEVATAIIDEVRAAANPSTLEHELAKADRRTAEQERIITAYRHVHRQLADAIGEDPGTGSELAGCVENNLRVLRSGLTEALGIIARARDGFFDTTTEAVDARCEELRKLTEAP